MDLKQIFIQNLRKFRNGQGISQRELAEMCATTTNYIGEIEIGRRFPSLKLIEKISEVLGVEPYRFFVERTNSSQGELEETIALLAKLPDETKLNIINHLSTGYPVRDDISN